MNKYIKKLSFAKIEFKDLQKIVSINESFDDNVFDTWFDYSYPINEEEEHFLTKLIEFNRRFIDSYSEEELKAHFIIPLTNKVDFFHKGFRTWYERPLAGVVNKVLLKGKTDFMIAKGIETPEIPYFFIQEYKKELGDRHPKNPLIAEMLVAMNLNRENMIKGAYIIGKIWNFIILKQTGNNEYLYFRSYDLNVLKITELKQIYINLQAVKKMPDL